MQPRSSLAEPVVDVAATVLRGPAFDLDTPGVVEAGPGGMYALVVPPLKSRDRIRIARRLARGGFADPAWAAAVVSTARARPAAGGPTVLQISVPLRAEPGPEPGHTTVYVDEAMTYRQSCRFARALGLLVDAQQRVVSTRRREWRVRTPVGQDYGRAA